MNEDDKITNFPDLGPELTRKIIKAADTILPIHEAQILTYMRLSKSPLGLLLNFNEKLLKDGIKRYALAEFARA